MALVIRLRPQGKKNRRSFRLVVTDVRSPRNGKYIEKLGWFDPHAKEDKSLLVNEERVEHWLKNGAMITEKAEALVMKKAPEMMKKYKR